MICSITLQSMQVSDIGLLLAGSPLSPFLKSGLTLALVQSLGSTPVESDLSNNRQMIGAISCLNSFKTTGFISSGPAALCGFRLDNNLSTQFRSMEISGIKGYLHFKCSNRSSKDIP